MAAHPCENDLVLDIDQDYSITNGANPSPIGTNNNSLYYRNRLYENDVDMSDNVISTISSSSSAVQKSIITCDDDKILAIETLRKEVIKMLINVGLPKNESFISAASS